MQGVTQCFPLLYGRMSGLWDVVFLPERHWKLSFEIWLRHLAYVNVGIPLCFGAKYTHNSRISLLDEGKKLKKTVDKNSRKGNIIDNDFFKK